jgi:micrococcal nuclease
MQIPLKITKKQKQYLIAVAIVLIASLFGIDLAELKTIQNNIVPTNTPAPFPTGQTVEAKVTSVVDGDTIVIDGNHKVRYIGVNTPEINKDTSGRKTGEQCFANESYLENKRLVEGKTVRLVRDVSNTDKYGRLLRYVYVEELFVNDYLINNGYAKTMTVKPDTKYYDLFKQSQLQAKSGSLGIWKACPTLTQAKPRQ